MIWIRITLGLMAGLFLVGAIWRIEDIGKQRRPMTAGDAIGGVVTALLFAGFLVYVALFGMGNG